MLFSGNCAFAESGKENLSDSTAKSEDDKAGEIIHLTKDDFLKKVFNYEKNTEEWVYEGSTPCIVDFYADWCPPCKKVDPILKELAKSYEGKIIVYKVNTDKERELAAAFGIRSIPTFLFIPKNGDPQSAAGALPRDTFVKIIDEFLLK